MIKENIYVMNVKKDTISLKVERNVKQTLKREIPYMFRIVNFMDIHLKLKKLFADNVRIIRP